MSTQDSLTSIDLSKVVASPLYPAPYLKDMDKEEIKHFFNDYKRYVSSCASVSGVNIEPSPIRMLIDDIVKDITTFTIGRSDNSWWKQANNDEVQIALTHHVRAHDESDANRVLSKIRMTHNKTAIHDLVEYIREFKMELNLLTQFGCKKVSLSDKMLVDVFNDGIEPKSMRARVKAFNSANVDTAYQHAIDKFRELDEASKIIKSEQSFPTMNNSTSNKRPRRSYNSYYCSICNKQGHSDERCWFKNSRRLESTDKAGTGHASLSQASSVEAPRSTPRKELSPNSYRK